MHILKALMTKELLQMKRDISCFLIGIVLPLILLFIYGFGVSLDMDHLRIGLVLEDKNPRARDFAAALQHSRYFDVTTALDRREIAPLVEGSFLRGMVVIPSYFSEFLDSPDKVAPIQVIADGSEPNTAAFVQNYVRGALQPWIDPHPLITIQDRMWYNAEIISRDFLIPGSLAIIMTLIGTLLTALVVAREWERGTMEALIATPVTVLQLVLGKLLPYFFLGLIAMGLCTGVVVFFYDVPFRGSVSSLLLISSAFLFTAIQLGLLISTLSKNQLIASQISMFAGFLPAFILSGFIFQISSMPMVIQWLTYLMPARYFVSCLQTLFLVGNVWEVLLPGTAWMALFGCLFLAITAFKLKKRID